MKNQTTAEKMVFLIAEECNYAPLNLHNALQAVVHGGYSETEFNTCFSGGIPQILNVFSSGIDAQMMQRLKTESVHPVRIRDKVAYAVWIRFELLQNYPEMIKYGAKYWALHASSDARHALWQSADHIWQWTGDSSTDYNYYTKRGLLSAVILSTTLYWVNDTSEKKEKTKAFLNRRIENVLTLGKITGKPMAAIMGMAQFFKPNCNKERRKDKNDM